MEQLTLRQSPLESHGIPSTSCTVAVAHAMSGSCLCKFSSLGRNSPMFIPISAKILRAFKDFFTTSLGVFAESVRLSTYKLSRISLARSVSFTTQRRWWWIVHLNKYGETFSPNVTRVKRNVKLLCSLLVLRCPCP